MRTIIKSSIRFDELVEKFKSNKEFINSASNSYNNRIHQRHAVNEYFYNCNDSDNEIVISQNAGHGGLSEVFAFVRMGDGNIEVVFKIGGSLPFNTLYYIILILSVCSTSLLFINLKLGLISLALLGTAFLIRAANEKSKRIIIEKITRILEN